MNASLPAAAQASERPRGRSFKSRLLCILAVTVCILAVSELLFAVPHFAAIFKDFDTELPSLTLFVMQMRFPVAAVLSLLALALVIKEIVLTHHDDITVPINLIILVIAGLVFAVSVLGLGLPLLSMFQSV